MSRLPGINEREASLRGRRRQDSVDFAPSQFRRIAAHFLVLGLSQPPGKARAAECEAPRLHVQLPPGSAWAERIEPLRAELRDARIDRCARVDIRLEGAEAVVSVTSRGRSATRRLSEPSELVRTVEALMVLPPAIEMAPSPSERVPNEVERAPPPPPEPTHVEAALGAAVRVGGNLYAGGGFSALADVVVDNYVLGVSGRWDVTDGYVSEPTAGDFSMESGAFGIVLGRRAALRWASLDVLLDGQIVVESQDQNSPGDGVDGDTLDTRFGVGLRASTPKPSGFRPFLLADIEASPARIAHSKRIDPALPLLPAWTCGLSLGIMWGPR